MSPKLDEKKFQKMENCKNKTQAEQHSREEFKNIKIADSPYLQSDDLGSELYEDLRLFKRHVRRILRAKPK